MIYAKIACIVKEQVANRTGASVSFDRGINSIPPTASRAEPSAGSPYRGKGTKEFEDDASLQAIRLFQEIAQVLAITVAHDGCNMLRPGRDERWWGLLADISGLPTTSFPEGSRPRSPADDPVFRFDPTPNALVELKVTVTELADTASAADSVDRIVIAILRSVERLLARDGLGGAYSAAVGRSTTQASDG